MHLSLSQIKPKINVNPSYYKQQSDRIKLISIKLINIYQLQSHLVGSTCTSAIPACACTCLCMLGSFQGQLNPLSSRSLIESCVMPVLIYGSEFWHLNTTLLSRLESFQAELGKRILRLPRTTANSIPLITLDWPSMRCRCLCAKLCFLFRACSGDSNTDTLREEVFKTLSYSDVEALDLIKQCRLLELPYSTNFTSKYYQTQLHLFRSESLRQIAPTNRNRL